MAYPGMFRCLENIEGYFMPDIPKMLLCLSFALSALAQNPTQGTASITGNVLDASGSGYTSHVRVFQIIFRQGIGTLAPRCFTLTRQGGHFDCPGLSAGQYLVQALPILKPIAPNAQNSNAIPFSFSYPNATDLSSASIISLNNGEEQWTNFQLYDVPVFDVSGILTNPAPSAAIQMMATDGKRSIDTGIDFHYDSATGAFSAGSVPTGHYLLTADWFVDGAEHKAAYPFVVGDTSVRDIRLSSLSNAEVSGHLLSPPADNTISQVRLIRTDGSLPDVTTPVKDGSFHFHPVPAGKYILGLPSDAPVYIGSVALGGESTSDSGLIIGPNQPALRVDATLQGPSLAIQGSVNQWDGSASTAEVVALDEISLQVYETVTDSQRRFSIGGLAPGTYRLFAWPGVNLVDYRNPNLLKRYDQDSTEVSITDVSLASGVALDPIGSDR
jgi:hypothetical protein